MALNATTKKALIDGLKEFARLVIFGAIGGAIAAAGAAVNLLPEPWMVTTAAGVITFIGKAWDKYVHKNENIEANGILPF